ncbi:MAG TPA: hypothetical protein VJO12_03130 [Stellaceae bacterium]|nr:hypothetical protein [Stellaceae bacterium]
MAQIGRLVATIKAERHAERVVQPIVESGERDQVVALLRRFVIAREQERLAWEETLRQMKAELAEAQAAAQAAQTRHEQEASRHQRDLADLELLHDHQRSIWNLDRRRLEITIDGLSDARATKSRRKRTQLAAGVAALLCIGVIGLALAGNSRSGDAVRPRSVIDSIRALSPGDLSCLIGCERPPEPALQQGRL